MLSGEATVGKTWVALLTAVHEITAGRSVVWIDADNMGPYRLLERLRPLAGNAGVDDAALAERFRYASMIPVSGMRSTIRFVTAITPTSIMTTRIL